MEMAPRITPFYIFNTNVYLLKQYEDTAVIVNRTAYESDWDDIDEKGLPKRKILKSSQNIQRNLSLIILNASILEGAVRQVFSATVSRDHHKLGDFASKQSDPSLKSLLFRSYKKIFNLHIDLEANGSWDNLKKQIKDYSDIKLDDYMSDKSYFDTLFHLRNAVAHGTALVLPKDEIINKEGDDYLNKWQSRLQSASVLAKKEFDCELFEALKHPFFAKVFMDKTKEFINNISGLVLFKNDQSFVFDNVKALAFGFYSPGDYRHSK
ncbi:HEPN domain-containing protein [Pantoea agglomerans]|uniref:HEPN domain-containing protein n=1 Tax=Enterobacter agglomerans TaxID=549 RepID=UPI003C7A3AD8